MYIYVYVCMHICQYVCGDKHTVMVIIPNYSYVKNILDNLCHTFC